MPLFTELRPYLQAALDELLEDFDPKAKRLSEQPVITRYRDTNANLRTQLCKIIRRAGLEPWPKLFQNLRSTRATEVCDMPGIPSHVAAEWFGHSATIADKHYRQVTPEHFERALEPCDAAAQSPAQQQSTETERNEAQQQSTQSIIPLDCAPLRSCASIQVGDAGLEPATSAL